MKSGAYQDDDGQHIWFRRSDYTLNEARREAASFAREMIGSWARARYLGQADVTLHDHDDWEDCQECGLTPAWAFETYEQFSSC